MKKVYIGRWELDYDYGMAFIDERTNLIERISEGFEGKYVRITIEEIENDD